MGYIGQDEDHLESPGTPSCDSLQTSNPMQSSGLGHSEPIAAEVITQLVQRQGTHLTAWVRIHRLVSRVRNRRKEAGGLERLRDPPAPSSFWGRMKRRLWCGCGQYRSTNSGPAARAWPPLPSSEPRSLPPPPFAFDHPPQSLTARWAAKLLARAATGECKPLFASRTLAAKKFAITRWALALAGLRRAGVGGFRRGREHFLGLSGLPTFGAATSIPLALSLPFLPSIRGLSILPVGASSPPSPSGGPAFGTAISALGVGGMKRLLTSLEKTPSLTRPTSPLTGQ